MSLFKVAWPAIFCAWAFFLSETAALAQASSPPVPTVSPDALLDVPPTPPGSPFPFFNDYSWRSFIALNWPASWEDGQRGQPDRSKPFGDTAGPRVWMTWKSRTEIFQPDGNAPSGWASYDGQNPCGPGFTNKNVTLSAFTEFGDFNQAGMKTIGNPLVAQNKTYVRYEVRANRDEFDSIVTHKWFVAANLPTKDTPQPFAQGSSEIKAAWRILTDKDTPEIRARYYVVPNAQVLDVATNKCVKQDIALVGFHIVTKTPDRPQWIWSTFEQVDNVPGRTTEPAPPPNVPLSFNDPTAPQKLIPTRAPAPISASNPPSASPTPMQVVRVNKIEDETMAMNRAYWALPGIKGTVWANYMLVATQWPTKIAPEAPKNPGGPFPTTGEVANTTMETYMQFSSATCMECHQLSNAEGRDFVMFVGIDAFRPATPAPADLFTTKLQAPPRTEAARAPLASDPVVKSLSDFFAATVQR